MGMMYSKLIFTALFVSSCAMKDGPGRRRKRPVLNEGTTNDWLKEIVAMDQVLEIRDICELLPAWTQSGDASVPKEWRTGVTGPKRGCCVTIVGGPRKYRGGVTMWQVNVPFENRLKPVW